MAANGWGLILILTLTGPNAVADRVTLSKGVLDQAASQHGESARNVLYEWEKLLNHARNSTTLTELQKLAVINNFFNQVNWVSDQEHWAQDDYWATPRRDSQFKWRGL